MADFKFRYLKTGLEFCCTEGDEVYKRVTGFDRAEYKPLGEVDPLTGEKVKKAAKAEKDAPATAEATE